MAREGKRGRLGLLVGTGASKVEQRGLWKVVGQRMVLKMLRQRWVLEVVRQRWILAVVGHETLCDFRGACLQ